MQVEVKNLSYVYGEGAKALSVRALDNVSLTIEEGEFFGVIGQTGSGKTTFVQHLNGLIKLGKDCGSIKIGEYDLSDKKCDFKLLRSKLGMVFQYPEQQLFGDTVFDDVAFGIKNFMPEKSQEETQILVKEALEMVGLDFYKVKDKSPFELSGGQKRRVAIAGVIVTKPEVLVLDEPVAGLDPVGKREFFALLHKLHKSFVKTVIIVSHDMDAVAEHCSRAVVFSEGKVVAEGTPKQIFSDLETTKSLGLGYPVTAYLSDCLNRAGVKIDCDLTVNGLVDAIISKLNGGNE